MKNLKDLILESTIRGKNNMPKSWIIEVDKTYKYWHKQLNEIDKRLTAINKVDLSLTHTEDGTFITGAAEDVITGIKSHLEGARKNILARIGMIYK